MVTLMTKLVTSLCSSSRKVPFIFVQF